MKTKLLVLALLSSIAPQLYAQPGHADLHKEIAAMDAALFDAVNTRNLEKLKTMFTTDLEFYHDKAGLTNYEQNLEASRKNFASGRKIRRELVGAVEVYPVPDYGAIQTGKHRFCDLTKADACSVYKFVHVWKKGPDGWKLARVMSFDH